MVADILKGNIPETTDFETDKEIILWAQDKSSTATRAEAENLWKYLNLMEFVPRIIFLSIMTKKTLSCDNQDLIYSIMRANIEAASLIIKFMKSTQREEVAKLTAESPYAGI